MSLDHDPVEQLLDRHGRRWLAEFEPPPLAGVLAVAVGPGPSRARWLWPLAAAVALLVVPLLTVVGISAAHRPAHPAGFLGDLPWGGAVLQADRSVLTIAVDVNDASYCLDRGLPEIRPVVSETSTTVTIRADAYRPVHPSPVPSASPGTVLACSARGYLPVPVTVRLRQPLGTRTLIDAKTGIRHPTLDVTTLLTPSWLPAGYRDRTVRWQDDDPQGGVGYQYDGPGGPLRVGRSPVDPRSPTDKVLATTTVLGHPAKVFTHDATSSTRCVVWNDSRYWWLVCAEGAQPPRSSLSADDVLRVARSLR